SQRHPAEPHTRGNPRHMKLGKAWVRDLIAIAALGVATVAHADHGYQVMTGTYTGNGANNRAITGVGFRPDFVIVKGSGATTAMARSGTMRAGESKPFGGALATVTNRIESLDADGFTVDADASVNGASVTYSWIAFSAFPG